MYSKHSLHTSVRLNSAQATVTIAILIKNKLKSFYFQTSSLTSRWSLIQGSISSPLKSPKDTDCNYVNYSPQVDTYSRTVLHLCTFTSKSVQNEWKSVASKAKQLHSFQPIPQEMLTLEHKYSPTVRDFCSLLLYCPSPVPCVYCEEFYSDGNLSTCQKLLLHSEVLTNFCGCTAGMIQVWRPTSFQKENTVLLKQGRKLYLT